MIKSHLLDYGQDPRHGVVVAVCANAQVNLLGVLVGTVCGHETKQRVFRCLLHGAKGALDWVGRHVELLVDLTESLSRIVGPGDFVV